MTGTHLVRRLPGRVAAYDLATGAVAWELPLSGAEIDNCPSSQQQSRNRVALLRAGGDGENECGSVTVLDISTGDEVFTTELPPIDRKNVAVGDVPVMFGDFVLVGSEAGGHLINADTGRRVSVAEEGQCREAAYAVVDDQLLAKVEGRALSLVATTDGSVAAYQSANNNDVPGLLLTVDAATGALSPLLPIGEESHTDDALVEHLRSRRFGGDHQQAVWTGRQFVLFLMVQRAETIGALDMVAFGTSR